MLGWSHECFRNMIIKRYGEDVYRQILYVCSHGKVMLMYAIDKVEIASRPGIWRVWTDEYIPEQVSADNTGPVDTQTYFDDSDTFRLFRAAATFLNVSYEDIWEMYGEFLPNYAWDTGWEPLLRCMADNLQEFLDNLNSMHYFIDKIAFQSELRGPTFQCELQIDGSLRLHYYSMRQGLFPIVKGLVRAVSKLLFNMDVKMSVTERRQERRKHGMSEHVIFTIEPDEDHAQGKQLGHRFCRGRAPADIDSNIGRPLLLSQRDFCRAFPTHICFNKQLIIEHCGEFLRKEYALADKRTAKLNDLLQLMEPTDLQMTFKGITSFLNSLFVFQLKHHSTRNNVETTSSKAFIKPLCLRGQMVLINSGQHMLYLCSPHVTTVRDLVDLNLFIGDMPMHDGTRDLVMLNQSRICQRELNKKLEEVSKRMKTMAEDLEHTKQQTEHLLYDFLPPSIAESIKANKQVHCQEYSDVTVLVSTLPDFVAVCNISEPAQIVHIMTDIFHRFDRLVDIYNVHKMLTIVDAYFVVGGAPNPCSQHYECVLNLALGMVMESKQVTVPAIGHALRVRIGIHSGPVIGAVLGHTRARYVILGETVNIAKRLCSLAEPNKILLSNSTRMDSRRDNFPAHEGTIGFSSVSKSSTSSFVFTSRGYVDTGNHNATCTHYLEKNEKRSAWDIIGRDKAPEATVDGYRELHSTIGNTEWTTAMCNVEKQQRVIEAFQSTNTGGVVLEKLRRAFRDYKNKDSGISTGSASSGKQESSACTLM